ncbi:hypothetical protein SRHO_G00295690 [Serrasalmus rhombeus]
MEQRVPSGEYEQERGKTEERQQMQILVGWVSVGSPDDVTGSLRLSITALSRPAEPFWLLCYRVHTVLSSPSLSRIKQASPGTENTPSPYPPWTISKWGVRTRGTFSDYLRQRLLKPDKEALLAANQPVRCVVTSLGSQRSCAVKVVKVALDSTQWNL